jgi:two-component system chemotaxis response regulator CheB
VSAASRPVAAATRRRVLVVDDSAFMRRLVSDVVQSTGEFEVVGTARDGDDAMRQVAALAPDLITLDVDMPGLDGLGALRRIMAEAPRPVVMLSAGGSDGGADVTLRALEAGAVEFVRKPSGAISLDLDVVGERLLAALRAASVATLTAPVRRALQTERAMPDAVVARPSTDTGGAGDPASPPQFVVVIASSTGGPAALAEIMPALPRWPHTAVLIAQHMPAGFTTSFARRLNARAQWPVQEAVHDAPLQAGVVYLAPGGRHLRVGGSALAPRLLLDDRAPVWGVRPAADPLFLSVAEHFGAHTVGVVLTGMGCDGAAGLAAIRTAGGQGVVQAPPSCVVAGMPEAALHQAGADVIAPLAEVARALDTCLRTMRTTRSLSVDEGWPDDDAN